MLPHRPSSSSKSTTASVLYCILLVAATTTTALSSSNSHDALTWNDSDAALRQIVANVRRVTVISQDGAMQNKTVSFPLPCSYDAHHHSYWIQESTSSLLAAKALVKTVLQPSQQKKAHPRLDSLAWDMLDALLISPQQLHDNDSMYFQSQGLLPKYWYIPTGSTTATGKDDDETFLLRILEQRQKQRQPTAKTKPPYLKGTRFPHWSLFSYITEDMHERHNGTHTSPSLQSSHRLSALPLHASILWDMVLTVIPPTTKNDNSNNETEDPQQQHPNKPPPYSYNYNDNRPWWDRVHAYYQRIYQHHTYLHQVVMRGCPPQKMRSNQQSPLSNDTTGSIPCYNILHPWESLMDPTSPAWEIVLKSVMQHIHKISWKVPFDIPWQVQESYDFPTSSGVYNAMVYLLAEGWSQVNITQACSSTSASTPSDPQDPRTCAEDAFFNSSHPKFAMLDVGYAAILAQADHDLFQMALLLDRVLPDDHRPEDESVLVAVRLELSQQISMLQQWQTDNTHLLQEELWNPTHQTYLSKYYHSTDNSSATTHMQWLDVAVSNNLVPFWNVAATTTPSRDDDGETTTSRSATITVRKNDNDSPIPQKEEDPAIVLTRDHWKDLSMQLLRRDGRYAFDCGRFPIWSVGCEEEKERSTNTTATKPIIQPLINYLIASGLFQSDKMDVISEYMSSQSLSLFMTHANHDYDSMANASTRSFGEAFGAYMPWSNLATLDACGTTSTTTAAIVYNFIVRDPTHANRMPLPPIRRSWVITLITVELFVAFAIGVSCLVVSFSLVRKLKHHSDMADELDWAVPTTGTEPPYYASMSATTTHTTTITDGALHNDTESNLLQGDDDDKAPLISAGRQPFEAKDKPTIIRGDESFFSGTGLN